MDYFWDLRFSGCRCFIIIMREMSVKTCQLCGKPLGRRGTEGEFCSKEHRNQSQLRRGLDRLEEADKVATLMRRRENLRQLPASGLQAPGACEPRASTDPISFPVRQMEPRFAPLKPALFQARVPQKETRFANPMSDLSRRSGASATRVMTPATQPFVARRPAPVLESKKNTKPGAGVVRASTASIPCHVPALKNSRRECGAALRFARPPVGRQRSAGPATAGAASLEKARQFQALEIAAVGGGAGETRAHRGRAFAKRSAIVPANQRKVGLQGGLPEPKPQPAPRAGTINVTANPRGCDIPRTLGMPCIPQLRATITVTGTRGSGLSPMRPVAYEPAISTDLRMCAINWDTAGAVNLPDLRSRTFQTGLHGTAPPIILQAYRDAVREHRAAEVCFAPEGPPFDPAALELQGVFPAPAGEAVRSSLDVIEEHFDSGLEQWAGDVVDWKLDAAGARPAGLALFRPTLSMGDYEFEFFTRIENRAVTYAFRAANVSNYLKITIAMVESGRYELRHCAVIGGIEEPAAAAPLPGVLRPGAAFTVKTRASQNDFTIWLDGELAAKWTDGRMPTGGIGFMAPRDDRARVYWVRLSQIEGPNSQAAAHRAVRSIQ